MVTVIINSCKRCSLPWGGGGGGGSLKIEHSFNIIWLMQKVQSTVKFSVKCSSDTREWNFLASRGSGVGGGTYFVLLIT